MGVVCSCFAIVAIPLAAMIDRIDGITFVCSGLGVLAAAGDFTAVSTSGAWGGSG